MNNDRVYIHEFIDIRGHNRANYMHHMTANWSPTAQAEREQLCYGVWALLGSTGAWPQTVNMWEEQGWTGLADSFSKEAVGSGAQDPKLAKWWARAAEFRNGGFDRIMLPAPWSAPIESLCARSAGGSLYAHELVKVKPGHARDLLERANEMATPIFHQYRWSLIGAFTTAMVNNDEALLLWSIPSWQDWAAGEAAHTDDPGVISWRASVESTVTNWHRILLVDAPLAPLRIGRQPAVTDRTDWQE